MQRLPLLAAVTVLAASAFPHPASPAGAPVTTLRYGLRPPEGLEEEGTEGEICRRGILGGLMNDYYRKAA